MKERKKIGREKERKWGHTGCHGRGRER